MANDAKSFPRDEVRSAVRFPLQLGVTMDDGNGILHATTQDVSSTGILFHAERLPVVGSSVRFDMVMPASIMGGHEDVLLHCTGRIVRHHEAAGRRMAAAVIDEYSLKAEPNES